MDKHQFSARRRIWGGTMRGLMVLCAAVTCALAVFLIVYVLVKGVPNLSWQLLSTKPSYLDGSIGILPDIITTVCTVLTTLLVVLPLGVCAAVYLTEYAANKRVVAVIEYAAETLSGIPSIIYGLVGQMFFCQFLGMKKSLLAGAMTLVIMNLPTIMRTTQESLKTVPQSYREGAFGLGAGKWRTIRTVVLPGCVDGVLTGGETKLGLVSDDIIPNKVCLIPDLLKTLPYKPFACSAIDALVHATESFLSPHRKTMTSELFSEKAMDMILKGFKLSASQIDAVADALMGLTTDEAMKSKYGVSGVAPLLFAVGDGNHSLATAKACYEEQKKGKTPEEYLALPARYALVEVVNNHDDALQFEPIHRVLFGVDHEKLMEEFKKFYPNTHEGKGEGHTIEVCWAGHDEFITVPDPKVQLAVGTLQAFIDEYLKKFGGEVDYIHGDEVTRELGSKEGNMGFLLPAMGKEQLFKTVMADGVLPRKTFSMGHAQDKRYYVEARKIR